MRRRLLLISAALTVVLLWASPALAFTDVPANHAYHDAIDDLSGRTIINGFPDGTFGPDLPVTRQQFAKMIVRTLQLPVTEMDVCLFGDVQTGGYSDPFFPDNYIAVCATNEITRGTSPSTFSPGDPIKRVQLLTMVVRSADQVFPGTLLTPPVGYTGSVPSFTDTTHAPNLRTAEFSGLLAGLLGYGPAWDPWAPATRGETALMLHNFLEALANPPDDETALVTSVTDGDTIRVDYQGENVPVRLIGIDAPEAGEPFSTEATGALTTLVGGKTVKLEFDVESRDMYGRLLAYVWVGGEMANAAMLRQGMATLYTVPPDVKYTAELQAAQDEAQDNHRGIWGSSTQSPLEIVTSHPDAAGNDNDNLNDEWIQFRAVVSGTLAGYAIEDATGHHYDFPDRVFTSGQVFKLHTGSGSNTQTDLYWGNGSAIWNNDGDTVKVLDSEGHVLLSESYSQQPF